ncbi:PREDICTED: uncharacterized protein LOC106811752 [Priapulus caudatus]|uniref:Uncharacterized protein LOC106811752 n=1 Tax=Priapulus caudatus TaxID=37621 RepID=A0ABM1EFI5_PRICU|nr:PREDICTED: uncharacterized protein LOC106811752 [Priapulus caudatus]
MWVAREESSMILPLETIPESGYMASTDSLSGTATRQFPRFRNAGVPDKFSESVNEKLDRLKGAELSKYVAEKSWQEYRDFRHRLHGSNQTLASENLADPATDAMWHNSRPRSRASSFTHHRDPPTDATLQQSRTSGSSLLSVVVEKSHEAALEGAAVAAQAKLDARTPPTASPKTATAMEKQLRKLVDIQYPKMAEFKVNPAKGNSASQSAVMSADANSTKTRQGGESTMTNKLATLPVLPAAVEKPWEQEADGRKISTTSESQPLLGNSWLKTQPPDGGTVFWPMPSSDEGRRQEAVPLLPGSKQEAPMDKAEAVDGYWCQDPAGEWVWAIGSQKPAAAPQAEAVPAAWHASKDGSAKQSPLLEAAPPGNVNAVCTMQATKQTESWQPSPNNGSANFPQVAARWKGPTDGREREASADRGDTQEGYWWQDAAGEWSWIIGPQKPTAAAQTEAVPAAWQASTDGNTRREHAPLLDPPNAPDTSTALHRSVPAPSDPSITKQQVTAPCMVAYLGVDEMYMCVPPLERDMHWDELEPMLPYTNASANHITKPHMGSMANLGTSWQPPFDPVVHETLECGGLGRRNACLETSPRFQAFVDKKGSNFG